MRFYYGDTIYVCYMVSKRDAEFFLQQVFFTTRVEKERFSQAFLFNKRSFSKMLLELPKLIFGSFESDLSQNTRFFKTVVISSRTNESF